MIPTVQHITAFLSGIGELCAVQLGELTTPDTQVFDVTPDQSATSGSLSWFSQKNLERHPERVAAFRGTVLICPESTPEGSAPTAAALLQCRTPKLAFTRVVNEFFRALTETQWPSFGGRAVVSPDAKIALGVDLAPGVIIGSGVAIGTGSRIGPNTCIANTNIGRNVIVGANCTIGMPGFGYGKDARGEYHRFPHLGYVVIEEGVEIGSNTCIDRGALGATTISRGVKIDNLVHIAHNVVVGENAMVIANSMIGGSTQIGPRAWVAPSVSVMNQVSIGADAVLGMGAVVITSASEGAVIVGNPGKPLERGKTK